MNCKNCNTILENNNNYCFNCGAKIIKNRITIKALFKSFNENYLNFDNKFLKTFIALFSKPDDVIGSYINGTRKKYVNVISYFAIAITISGIQIYVFSHFFPDLNNISSIITEAQQKNASTNLKFVRDYQSVIMMLYVPLYALQSRIVFLKNKTFNYAEHLVIFMYVLAQVSIIGSIITIFGALFGITLGSSSVVLLFFQIIFSAYCLKKLFQLSVKKIILKTLLFLLILFLFLILFSIIYTVIMTQYYGSFQEYINSVNGVD